MLPRDEDGYPADPVERLDESLTPQVVSLHDPARAALIASWS